MVMTLIVGQVIQNRYRIDGLLGQGGMGAVYLAFDLRLQQATALKENAIATLGISRQAVEASRRQFEREALVLARLRHPNLPRVIDHFITPDGNQYLVMDYVEGEDLAQIIDHRGALSEKEAVAWVSQVCNALDYLHSQSPAIIHRDIKPQNIKVTPQGQVFLVDFGIAKIGDAGSKTMTGALGVTPGFSPPEQYSMAGTDARSDVYALGATLYALLTGQAPPESILLQSDEVILTPPCQINRTVTPAIQQVVLKAMETRRTNRFQAVKEFRAALSDQTPSAHIQEKTGLITKPESPLKFPVWVWGVGAIVFVALLAIGLWVVLQNGNEASDEIAQVTQLPTTKAAFTPEPNTIFSPTPHKALPTPSLAILPSQTPIPTSTSLPTQTASKTPTRRPVVAYQTISLSSIANSSLDFNSPPVGDVNLEGIPFQLSDRIFKSQASSPPYDGYPTRALLPTDVPQAYRIHLLLNTGNGLNYFNGQNIGQIVVYCNKQTAILKDLQLGRDVREWHAASNVVFTASEVRQVWSGTIAGHSDLVGYIDMLTFDLPGMCQDGRLTALEIIDTSVSNVDSLDPALDLIGITVEYRQ